METATGKTGGIKKEAGRDHHEPHGQEVDSEFPPACHLHIQYSTDGRKMQGIIQGEERV